MELVGVFFNKKRYADKSLACVKSSATLKKNQRVGICVLLLLIYSKLHDVSQKLCGKCLHWLIGHLWFNTVTFEDCFIGWQIFHE